MVVGRVGPGGSLELSCRTDGAASLGWDTGCATWVRSGKLRENEG